MFELENYHRGELFLVSVLLDHRQSNAHSRGLEANIDFHPRKAPTFSSASVCDMIAYVCVCAWVFTPDEERGNGTTG